MVEKMRSTPSSSIARPCIPSKLLVSPAHNVFVSCNAATYISAFNSQPSNVSGVLPSATYAEAMMARRQTGSGGNVVC